MSTSGPSLPDPGFDTQVFINCPFDRDYFPLLRPLLFGLVYAGLTPRIALERSDSGEQRLHKIVELLQASRYSIHDLSRLKAETIGEFYRLNMPFELGIDYGARHFGTARLNEKRFLILEKDLHEFKKALSDLSGVDIKAHRNQPDGLLEAVRDWLVETVGLRGLPTPTVLMNLFNDFTAYLYDKLTTKGSPTKDVDRLPVPEYLDYLRAWVADHR